jgi:hypothetical protein
MISQGINVDQSTASQIRDTEDKGRLSSLGILASLAFLVCVFVFPNEIKDGWRLGIGGLLISGACFGFFSARLRQLMLPYIHHLGFDPQRVPTPDEQARQIRQNQERATHPSRNQTQVRQAPQGRKQVRQAPQSRESGRHSNESRESNSYRRQNRDRARQIQEDRERATTRDGSKANSKFRGAINQRTL